jgi:hypothetical protein
VTASTIDLETGPRAARVRGLAWLRHVLPRLALALVSTGVLLAVVEVALYFYVHEIRQYGRVFQTDLELGWSSLPEIDVIREVRKRAYRYRVVTDAEGHRIAEPGDPSPVQRWRESSGRKLLVVGDSQAEGWGVDVEQRFDRLLAAQRPDWSSLAVGVGGFDPCQELVLARRYLGDLQAGDVFVLLTTGNDFRDLLVRRPTGRSKPWCTLDAGRLAVHAPDIGFSERLRDVSYLGYLVVRRLLGDRVLEYSEYSQEERAASRALYEGVVRSLAHDLVPPGVVFAVAHNADWLVWDDGTRDVFSELGEDPRIHELPLDPVVVGSRPPEESENLLGDHMHWSRSGHAAVAEALERFLDRPEIAGAVSGRGIVTASDGRPASPPPATGV